MSLYDNTKFGDDRLNGLSVHKEHTHTHKHTERNTIWSLCEDIYWRAHQYQVVIAEWIRILDFDQLGPFGRGFEPRKLSHVLFRRFMISGSRSIEIYFFFSNSRLLRFVGFSDRCFDQKLMTQAHMDRQYDIIGPELSQYVQSMKMTECKLL